MKLGGCGVKGLKKGVVLRGMQQTANPCFLQPGVFRKPGFESLLQTICQWSLAEVLLSGSAILKFFVFLAMLSLSDRGGRRGGVEAARVLFRGVHWGGGAVALQLQNGICWS